MFALCLRRIRAHVTSIPRTAPQKCTLTTASNGTSHDAGSAVEDTTLVKPPVYRPSRASLALRAKIAREIQPLRRITPNVPFWDLRAHWQPVLRLYRSLLRAAPTEEIRWKITQHFRKNQHLTSPQQTKLKLRSAHKLLEVIQKANAGDKHWQAVLQRYSKMVYIRREKQSMARYIGAELAWQRMWKNRPILTGGYVMPSVYNGPLPRMKPEPAHLSGMVNWRRAARARRTAQFMSNFETLRDVDREARAERMLENGDFQPMWNYLQKEWKEPIQTVLRQLMESYAREGKRAQRPFPPEMLEQIKAARTAKIENKTRERQRERRGEVLQRTLNRANKGPPPHVIALMSPRRRYYDKVARSSITEVGYVGKIKKKLGFKLKNPDPFAAEDGKAEDQAKLDALEKQLREENTRRRVRSRRIHASETPAAGVDSVVRAEEEQKSA
ncbi:LYR motif-containing protein [Phanerochaete sordida]|uniref:LYR motif-containing protein n=1 Tax=Phanerochaete sordida TaxID=48140 RepID=A0A9P3LAV2_9APHY|nr:LYR motif-containing protein [Phanerochaete sordida]